MSYIRCLSNPEGLYIICDGNAIEIMQGPDPIRLIPIPTWEKLIRRYNRDEYDVIDGVETEEQFTEDGYCLKYGKLFVDFLWLLTSPDTPPPHPPIPDCDEAVCEKCGQEPDERGVCTTCDHSGTIRRDTYEERNMAAHMAHYVWPPVQMWDVTWHYIAHNCETVAEHLAEIREELKNG